MLAVALAVFAGTFLVRFLTVEFSNDHFVHLSRGRQILLGDVPDRDFFDPGLFLQYYASAAALTLSGGTLLGEAILTSSAIALGAALTFVLAATLSASTTLGLAAAVAAAATAPRLYSYPKVFLFVLALVCAHVYARTPSKGGLVTLAAVTVIAFLFRHDHGVYIGITLVGFFVLLDWDAPRRALSSAVRYAALTALFLMPFAIFIEATTGLVAYVEGSAPQVSDLVTPRIVWPTFDIGRQGPLPGSAPQREQRIHVRWTPEADDAARRERESRYGLTQPDEGEERTWSYVLADETPDNIRALMSDPLVADTHGLDRARLTIEKTRQLNPGVFTEGNARALLYYVSLLLPLAGAAMLLAAASRGRVAREDIAVVGALVIVCAVIEVALVRGSPETRLPDVAAPMAALGAWVTARWIRDGPTTGSRPKGRLAAAAIAWLVMLWSCSSFGHAVSSLEASGVFEGPRAVWQRINDTSRNLRLRPIDAWAPVGSTGLRALTRYVHECTAPDDRVLALHFLPELFFYSERGFAGGQVYLLIDWHSSVRDQRLTVARLARERVPVVIVDVSTRDRVWAHFPLVADYVSEHYVPVAESTFGGDTEYSVLADRRLTASGTHASLGLPCFR
jgi:hypothetical protein